MSWSLVRLGDICNFVRGPFGGALKKESFVEDGFAVYEQQHAIYNQFSDIRYYIDSDKFEDLKRFELHAGDIIMSCSGTMGKVAVVPDGIKQGIINQALLKLTPNCNLDIAYFMHWLKSESFQFQLGLSSHGAAIKNVASVKVLKELEIPLPPLEEQKRIAAILDKADAVRQKRKQAIDLADEFLRSVFLDMFGDPVTNPKGLSQVKLTEFADVITGFAFKSAEYVEDDKANVRLCRGANTLPGYFDWKDTAYWDSSKLSGIENYKINAGDVILAMDRPWISSGLKVCVFPDNERDTYLVQRVARMRPKNSLYTDYLYSSILSKAFERHCCPTETTVPHISPVELKNFSLLMPDEDLLKKYNNAVTTVRKSKSAMEAAWLESNHIFESLSQKAFSGQL
ncbi:restriction endonuclease subunit S [Vibrio rotiferianus]|uniref:restriction endonuclease subunit S n=1 Tax=Vibrio rotiferianus TaxID=190895 RepID=UPI00289475A1|nr:Restriction modification system DNA specificity domain [Vibrio rotiferianus]